VVAFNIVVGVYAIMSVLFQHRYDNNEMSAFDAYLTLTNRSELNDFERYDVPDARPWPTAPIYGLPTKP
jgi:hypothetical protein